MGRWAYSNRHTTDEVKSITTKFLRAHDYFNGYVSQGGISWSRNGVTTGSVGFTVSTMDDDQYLQFRYVVTDRQSGQSKNLHYKVPLVATQCHFGGSRWWFLCPSTVNGEVCNRRVGVLYLVGDYFACRHCHNLVYESSREHRSFYEPFGRLLKLNEERKAILASTGRKGLSRRQAIRLIKLHQKSALIKLPEIPKPVVVIKREIVKKPRRKK